MVSSFKPIYFHIPRSEIVEVFFPLLGCHIAALYCYQTLLTPFHNDIFKILLKKPEWDVAQITVER